jgi:hypothetical protein
MVLGASRTEPVGKSEEVFLVDCFRGRAGDAKPLSASFAALFNLRSPSTPRS